MSLSSSATPSISITPSLSHSPTASLTPVYNNAVPVDTAAGIGVGTSLGAIGLAVIVAAVVIVAYRRRVRSGGDVKYSDGKGEVVLDGVTVESCDSKDGQSRAAVE